MARKKNTISPLARRFVKAFKKFYDGDSDDAFYDMANKLEDIDPELSKLARWVCNYRPFYDEDLATEAMNADIEVDDPEYPELDPGLHGHVDFVVKTWLASVGG